MLYFRQWDSALQPALDILSNILLQLPSFLLHIQLSDIDLSLFLPSWYAIHGQLFLEIALDILHLIIKLKSDD